MARKVNESAQKYTEAEQVAGEFELDSVDRKILEIMGTCPSASQEEIAVAVGFSRAGIVKRLRRAAFKAALRDLQKGLIETLQDGQLAAIRRLRELLESNNPLISLKAALALLAPLSKTDLKAAAEPQHVVYAVKFGEGGQLIRSMRPMRKEEYFLDPEEESSVSINPEDG